MSNPDIRAILIGGSSHSGKSTLAEALGARPGWTHVSTDALARHPGRPWPLEDYADRPHVIEHYRDLSGDELITEVLAHYKRQWPTLETLIASHVKDTSKPCLVLEGSALWPEEVAGLEMPSVAALWLTAPDTFFEARIKAGSGYDSASPDGRALIEKFLARTLRYNTLMMDAVRHHAGVAIDVSQNKDVDALSARVMTRLA
jgi:2-phosphoglycerate kinase